jgi:hypothetical protein
MKLSELTLDMIKAAGHKSIFMHYDASDCERLVKTDWELERVKNLLMERWGDVDITLNAEPCKMHEAFIINDEKWKADHEAYMKWKGEMVMKWGCE